MKACKTRKPKILRRPKMQTRKALDYNGCVRWIEQKYKVKLRDFASSHSHFTKWCNAQGLPKKDSEGNDRSSSQIFWKQYQKHPDGEKKEPPYLDFWHWIVDGHNISNGCEFDLSFDERGNAQEPEWVQEILQMFKKEFGKHIKNNSLTFYVNW